MSIPDHGALTCAVEGDSFRLAFKDKRRQAVGAVLPALAARLKKNGDRAVGEQIPRWLDQMAALPEQAARDLVTSPMFGYWWLRLSQTYRQGDAGALLSQAVHFPRFLAAASMRHGLAFDGLRLAVSADGWLRLPGWPLRIPLPAGADVVAASDGETVTLAVGPDGDAGSVWISVQEETVTGAEPSRVPSVRPGIWVDGADPWVTEYLAVANANTRAEGGRGDATAVPPDATYLKLLQDAINLLGRSWPEMHAELGEVVRQVVPFESLEVAAFSNSALDGVVFLRTDLGDVPTVIERLVHETAHLRLNDLFALFELHEHAPDERVPSPYRGTLRPVDGLFHGAFVFARIGTALARTYETTGESAYLNRLREVLKLQDEALEIIDDSVRLTERGSAIFAEIRTETERLERAAA
ncbi:HEXXH motif-containing putative peptide modification protein [Nonomuraea sp. NPDC049141]|uniref:aKG-HExxH-type peptide beta-hydroxylase n=1 Tax=Nonomuraea sp. NPDC049141 TaxID=3155500 RepID=UPI0033C64678